MNTTGLTRRQFVSTALLLGAGVLWPIPWSRAFATPPSKENIRLLQELDAAPAGRPLKVVILGAGMAGLCAAYELQQRGHRPILLEAEPRHIGGRVRTLHFGDGLIGEAGAMRIPAAHELTRHYIAELGLGLRPFVMGNPNAWVFGRGTRVRAREVGTLAPLYDLPASEADLTPDAIYERAVLDRIKALTPEERAGLGDPLLQSSALRRLDAVSLRELFVSAGFSNNAIEYMATAYGLEGDLHISALEFIREDAEDVWTGAFHEIIGGTERLAKGLAERLRVPPRGGCEVIAVERDEATGRLTAVYKEREQMQREDADAILCTLPFSVLTGVHLPVSDGKRRAIRTLHYDQAGKAFAVARQRFWERDDGIYGGGSLTDLPIGSVYYPADNAEAHDPDISAAPAVLLASYTWGITAARLSRMPVRRREQVVRQALSRLHPQAGQAGMIERVVTWDWTNARYARGAYALFLPGQQAALQQDVIRPEGQLYFAGEHVSLDHSWIQGALASALRAVTAMLHRAETGPPKA